MKKLLLFLMAVLGCLTSSAYDFEVGGIYYKYYNSVSVSVTYGTVDYSGDVVIPATVTYKGKTYEVGGISSSAFSGCDDLISVSIPSSVGGIGQYAFYRCKNLTAINVAADNQFYYSVDGVLFQKDPSTIEFYPAGKTETNYAIPNGVNKIEDGAFGGCINLISVDLPNSVTIIGQDAFNGCSGLTSVEIPNSVEKINGFAFSECTALTSAIISGSLTELGYSIFGGCTSLSLLEIQEGVAYIGPYMFSDCTSLPSVVIPNSVTAISEQAFAGCTSLSSVEISNGVETIERLAFSGCSALTSIKLPKSVTRIDDGAFEYCTNLISIEMPAVLESLGSGVLLSCPALLSVTVLAETPPTLYSDICSSEVYEDATLYVPENSVSLYKSANIWEKFNTIKNVGEDVGINSVTLDADVDGPAYNLQGTRVPEGYKGIVIQNGKKYLLKCKHSVMPVLRTSPK
ncbi:MAG: leucine-rich repeat domain-containing protein [Bacteroidales bacterium]|nr:leucine-rich repeat domain-containing protein [Bacteroidales bacterium]